MDDLNIPQDLKEAHSEALAGTELDTTFNDVFVRELIERIARLRGILIKCGRNAGAGLSDAVTDEFLALLPEEIKLRLARG
jgi:hypothetical protein